MLGEDDVFAFIPYTTDCGDDRGGSDRERLEKAALVRPLEQLRDGHLALARVQDERSVEPGERGARGVRCDEGEDRGARDPGEDRAVEGRCHHVERAVVALEDGEEVHRTDLGDGAVEEPEALVVPELRGCLLGAKGGGVVERELVPAGTAGPGADVVADGEQRGGLGASAEERPGGAEDDVQCRRVRWSDAKTCGSKAADELNDYKRLGAFLHVKMLDINRLRRCIDIATASQLYTCRNPWHSQHIYAP